MSFVEDASLSVLSCASPAGKVRAARAAAANWSARSATKPDFSGPSSLPDRPARPDLPPLTTPKEVPKRRPGSQRGRTALLHALAHIELNAIDLAFDMAARFAGECETRLGLGHEFIGDWLIVGKEEADHFELIENRLQQLGSHYGAMNAHDGLWQAALKTRTNWRARLAVVPMVLEARGLDVSPATIDRLRENGDQESAEILNKIYLDEINHVKIGVKWFTRLCDADGIEPEEAFRLDLAQNFRGLLKGPFNVSARSEAGLLPNFYQTRS